jgi:formylglycine-generating enzyme required for sulfatase activity
VNVLGNVNETPPEAGALTTGARIGRYVVLEHVGSGAMGSVYAAYDPELDRKVALKLLKSGRRTVDPTAQARLLREAKAMGRLAHPNVIAVHDAGVYEEQVFLAMEFLAGGTLRGWLSAQPRSWREILDVFIAAAGGLAAAHAAGLIHRDFKPDNVLLDREGRPRVVDFGLAREANSREGEPSHELSPAFITTLTGSTPGHESGHLETLTRTGAVMGTPAYMAPEQFLAEPTDERTDQFSFCVALYEALYGQRPFGGDNLLSLGASVTEGQFRPMPKDHEVPTWLRRALLRGLRTKPAERYPSMGALIAALLDDPAVKRRRRLLTAGAAAVVVAGLVVAQQVVHRRRVELERRIAAHVEEGTRLSEQARTRAKELRDQRARAFAAFDAGNREQAESLWREGLGMVSTVAGSFEKGEEAFETALVLDPSRLPVRVRLGDLRMEHLALTEELRMDREAAAIAARLPPDDVDGSRRRALAAAGTVIVRADTPGASVALERYERDRATGLRSSKPVGTLAAAGMSLPAGSYRLVLEAPGHAPVLYPFALGAGQRREIQLYLPPSAEVPTGFVYVAPGEFWYGDADEQLRTQFLDAAPLHRRSTDAYLIARAETTFREWIAFLDSLPAAQRTELIPDTASNMRGSLRLKGGADGWQLSFQPTSVRYTARVGEPVVYLGRKQRARQDWLDFPVSAISPPNAERYLQWLRATGRVPGARFCTELEWERAARGADERSFPSGDDLRADDANFDITYGKVASAYGPDAVGSHPLSRSPFGVDDLTGNVLELVLSAEKPGEFVIRGGAYYFGAATARSTNRQVVATTFRDVTAGLRVCAPAPSTGRP